MSQPKNPITRILLVEDDLNIANVIKLVLPMLDIPYEFVHVLDAESGLAEWEAQPFDLMLTDYNLRGMNGMALARTLRARGIYAPVILTTAYDGFELRREARENGINYYLPKPFFMEDLIETVRAALSGTHTREVNGH